MKTIQTFPMRADYDFWITRKRPRWYPESKGVLAQPFITPDAIVNAHGGMRINCDLHNLFSLFHLWKGNRDHDGLISTPKAFFEYLTSYTGKNWRYKYAYRVLRKFEKSITRRN